MHGMSCDHNHISISWMPKTCVVVWSLSNAADPRYVCAGDCKQNAQDQNALCDISMLNFLLVSVSFLYLLGMSL